MLFVSPLVHKSDNDIEKISIDNKDELAKYISGVGKNTENDTLVSILNIEHLTADGKDTQAQ